MRPRNRWTQWASGCYGVATVVPTSAVRAAEGSAGVFAAMVRVEEPGCDIDHGPVWYRGARRDKLVYHLTVEIRVIDGNAAAYSAESETNAFESKAGLIRVMGVEVGHMRNILGTIARIQGCVISIVHMGVRKVIPRRPV